MACAQNQQATGWRQRFVAMLPVIVKYVARAFRSLRPDEREECIQEAVAGTFAAYATLVKRGRERLAFATVLARYSIRQVRVGRQVGCTMNSNDMSSPYAQIRKRFRLGRLDRFDLVEGWQVAIVEDLRTPILDQVCFRVDFPEWLRTLPRRDRKIAEALSEGRTTTEVARRFGLTLGRVSQLRREFERSWLEFQGEAEKIALLAAA